MDNRKYAVVVEGSADGFSAYSPDLPGCVAAGSSLEEVRRLMGEALELHVNSMVEDGEPIPESSTVDAYVVSLPVKHPQI